MASLPSWKGSRSRFLLLHLDQLDEEEKEMMEKRGGGRGVEERKRRKERRGELRLECSAPCPTIWRRSNCSRRRSAPCNDNNRSRNVTWNEVKKVEEKERRKREEKRRERRMRRRGEEETEEDRK